MGVGGPKPEMKEIAETKAAAKDEQFEMILERVQSSGGEIVKDETSPLYVEIGAQEFEAGTQRVVEFNLNKLDFQLTRNVETHILQGAGHQKHLQELEAPRSKISMKRKSEASNDWQVVDLEDMF